VSLVEVYQRFRGLWCLHHQGDHRRTHRRENLKSYLYRGTLKGQRLGPSVIKITKSNFNSVVRGSYPRMAAGYRMPIGSTVT
jgi:hypothetical protein